MKKLPLLFLLLAWNCGYCWNALGHRLVAQIAYNHLTTQAKLIFERYNHALDKVYRKQNLVNAAAWLDSLRDQEKLLQKHYINLPFSLDRTPLKSPNTVNAISAIEEAQVVLQNPEATEFDKGFSLRIVLHVVGDIHQPLHAVSQYSIAHPHGDKGGNLFYLGRNRIGNNLHVYWDKGGGYLSKKRYSPHQLANKARQIEKKWPCKTKNMNLNVKNWAQESFQLAINQAYQLKRGQKPNKSYQSMVKRLTEERIALAGCRLAALLNKTATIISSK